VSNSEELGFAIPSDAILREIKSLVASGSYDLHPWLGATGTDMTYEIAKTIGTSVTYGWLIASASSETGLHRGTSQALIAGSVVTIDGDVIVAINGTRIMSVDDLLTYLEEYTLPGQTINVTIVRNNESMTLQVNLGKRPSPSTA
jgi:S1-C subfamily serine protease